MPAAVTAHGRGTPKVVSFAPHAIDNRSFFNLTFTFR